MSDAGDLAARLWPLYARHAEVVFAGGPAPKLVVERRWFLATSGSPHVDLNQAVLFGGATAADVEALGAAATEADVPILLGCSAGAGQGLDEPLASAGFVPLPSAEYSFHLPGVPRSLPDPPPFTVRRIESDPDLQAMQAMFLEVHGYGPDLTEGLHVRPIRSGAISGWLAWDGAEPVSFAIVTRVEASLSLWEVMTPARHRRRGAGRAIVVEALRSAAAASPEPITETLFWSSPAGKPLYDALGFQVVDSIRAWARGASDEDLAAVGAL